MTRMPEIQFQIDDVMFGDEHWDQLSPCPLCGRNPINIQFGVDEEGAYAVPYCDRETCGVVGPVVRREHWKREKEDVEWCVEEAKKKWNQRIS